LRVVLEVREFGDDVGAVVDGVAAAAALSKDLPVFESGVDVFGAGADPAVSLAVVVVHGAACVVAAGCGDRCDGAVAAITEHDWSLEGVGHCVATMTSLRLPRQHGLTAMTLRR
jgi:hypothetical protein